MPKTPSLAFTATIHNENRPDETHAVNGRVAWALLQLVQTNARGVTPIDRPAPRWSHYIFVLRDIGFVVETIHEPHKGPFPGTHARYILRQRVTISGGTLSIWANGADTLTGGAPLVEAAA